MTKEEINETIFNEIEFYDKYKGKITCAYEEDIKISEGKERCYAKRTQEREKYLFQGLTDNIVLIECPKDIIAIEFETHNNKQGEEKKEVSKEQLKEWIKQTAKNCQDHKLDYCICSHGGTSDYVYICNLQNLIENKEIECKKEIVKLIIPKEANDFLDLSNLGKTLIPIINKPHWKKKKYKGAIHKIIEGKNPIKHKNKIPDIVLQRVFDNERPNFPTIKDYGDSDINSISLSSIISTTGLKKRGSEYQGSNPWHGSDTGMNFMVNPSKNVWFCFRCNAGGSIAKAIGLNKGIISSCNEDLSPEQFKQVLQIAREEYGLKKPEVKEKEEKKEEKSHDLKTFIFDKDEVIQNRVFTSHLLDDNIFGFGLLLPRMEDINDKNKNKIGEKQVWRPVVITSNHRGLVVSQWMKNEYKIEYSELPYEMKLKWELKDIDNYLHKNPPTINGLDLFNDIKEQYEYYSFFREKNWYNTNSLWDIDTYFHQLFSSFPIKEERGIVATGKTKAMVVSSNITLNATEIMVNPSEPTLFRETEIMRPTKYIDEAEKLFKWTKQGLEPDNRVELINASYSRNGSVPRQEKYGNKWVTKWYHVYSPTRIGSINGMYGATETRCITQIHTKSLDNDIRGERDPEDDRDNPKWQKIRNKCYLFALQNWKKVQSEYLNFNIKTTIKKRDLQLWKPLLVLAKIIDEKNLLPEILTFAEKISRLRKIDALSEGTNDYKFLWCVNELLLNNPLSEKVYLNDIRENYNSRFRKDEPTNIGYNKTISTHLDKLGFRDLRDKDRMGSYYLIDKSLFDEIISPITTDFSSQSPNDEEKEEKKEEKPKEANYSSFSSHSSHLKVNSSNNGDECVTNMTNNNNSNNNNNKKCDEYDECDEYDGGLDMNAFKNNKKNNILSKWTKGDLERMEYAKKDEKGGEK